MEGNGTSDFIDEATCAQRIGVELNTLRLNRQRGKSDIPYIRRKHSRLVSYHWPTVYQHMLNNMIIPSEERAQRQGTAGAPRLNVPGKRGRPRKKPI